MMMWGFRISRRIGTTRYNSSYDILTTSSYTSMITWVYESDLKYYKRWLLLGTRLIKNSLQTKIVIYIYILYRQQKHKFRKKYFFFSNTWIFHWIYNLYLCSTKKKNTISLASKVCIFYIALLYASRVVRSFVPTLYIASGSWTLIEIRPVPMLAREKDRRNNDAVQRRSSDFVKSRVEERASVMLLLSLRRLRIRSPAPIAISRLRVLINPNCTTGRERGWGEGGEIKEEGGV